jgi:aconitate hydratase
LGITGYETFSTVGLTDDIQPGHTVTIQAVREDGSCFEFQAIIRLENPNEVGYYRNGGITQTVVRKLLRGE